MRASCLGSTFELEGDLRRFGKPITMFFHVVSTVSVAARDYAFEKNRYDPDGGLTLGRRQEQVKRRRIRW